MAVENMSEDRLENADDTRRKAYLYFSWLGYLLFAGFILLMIGPIEISLLLFLIGLIYPLLLGFFVIIVIEMYFAYRIENDLILFFLITLSIVVFLIFVLNSGVAELLSLVTDKGPTNFGAEHPYYSAIAGVLQLPEQLLTGILGGYAALVLGISRNRLKSMHE